MRRDGVKVLRISVDDTAKLVEALTGQDAVFSLVSGHAIVDQHKTIDAAVTAGVKWFVPSEFGHNTTDERILKFLPKFSDKIKVVDDLKSREKDGLSWVSVITALFFDWVSNLHT
jgi:saccharopine dehydrogenase-like NADP-dependent oxidoreductase